VTLDADAIATYRRDGFVSVGEMFTPAEIAAMNDAADEFVDRARQLTSSDEIFDLGPDHRPGRVQLRRIRDPERHHRSFAEAHRHARLLDELAFLLGPDIRAVAGKLNIKEPGASTVVEWHQDWAYGPRTNDDVLTVGIALGPMDRQSGCLEVIPGSHTGPVLDHERAGTFTGTVTDPSFVPNGAVPIELEAGDVSIHHVRALHGSAPNRSGRPRRLLLFSYAAADAWPLEDAAWLGPQGAASRTGTGAPDAAMGRARGVQPVRTAAELRSGLLSVATGRRGRVGGLGPASRSIRMKRCTRASLRPASSPVGQK
jgi:phytanoyl-CoA hydroxylase